MSIDRYTKIILTVIALSLAVIAAQQIVKPAMAEHGSYHLAELCRHTKETALQNSYSRRELAGMTRPLLMVEAAQHAHPPGVSNGGNNVTTVTKRKEWKFNTQLVTQSQFHDFLPT